MDFTDKNNSLPLIFHSDSQASLANKKKQPLNKYWYIKNSTITHQFRPKNIYYSQREISSNHHAVLESYIFKQTA